jgi:hypothetical protein
MRTNVNVLLVEARTELQRNVGTWLEEHGFDVTICPGPARPDFVCVGDRTGSCPLIAESDVVVLDCDLDSECALEGTHAADLFALYRSSDRPVVLIGGEEIAEILRDEDVVFMHDEPKGGLVGAVERLVSPLEITEPVDG